MRTGHGKVHAGFALALALTVVLSVCAAAESLDIYRGGLITAQAIKAFGGWGSGITEYGQNNQFLRIVTQGYYQGGRLELNEVDLTPFVQGDPAHSYLELELQIEPRPEDVKATTEEEYVGEEEDLEEEEEEEYEEEEYEEEEYYYEEEEGYGQPQEEEVPRVTKLRVVLETDQGKFGTEGHSAFGAPLEQEGWSRVDIPLAAFKVDGKVPQGKLKRILLFGNGQDAILVRAIRLFKENPEDVVIPKCPDDLVVQQGNPVELTAKFEGNQRARFYWDFDLSDGLQRDAVGQSVRAVFDVPGTYVVTLIAEPIGSRAVPRMDTMVVTVTPIPGYGRAARGYTYEEE